MRESWGPPKGGWPTFPETTSFVWPKNGPERCKAPGSLFGLCVEDDFESSCGHKCKFSTN